MVLPSRWRAACAALVALCAGCATPVGTRSPGASFVLDRWEARRDRANVPLAGSFPDEATAMAVAARPLPDGPTLSGQVAGSVGDREEAIAGALVATSDGRAALTRADGTFTLPGGWPSDGAFVAAHPDYVASAVTALPEEASPTLHLRALVGRAPGPGPAAEKPLVTRGRVVDPGGQPVAGAVVVLEDAAGSFSAPAETDGQGMYELRVFAAARQVAAGTLLIAGGSGGAWLGVARAIALDVDHTEVPDATAYRATRALVVGADNRPEGAASRTSVELALDDGVSLALPAEPVPEGMRALVADVPEARFRWRVEAQDAVAGVSAVVQREPVELPPGESAVVQRGAFLDVPDVPVKPLMVLNEALEWSDVRGAIGFHVTVAGLAEQGFRWEAYSQTRRVAFSLPAGIAPGEYAMTIAAYDGPDVATRALAAAKPRALRLMPTRGTYRRSARQVRLAVSGI